MLGDLWRGERRLVAGPHYQWAWKRILAGGPTTMRYGHTMMFDPGAIPPYVASCEATMLATFEP